MSRGGRLRAGRRLRPVLAAAQHPAPPAPPAAERVVAVVDTGYGPAGLVVAPGTTVTWRNAGRTRHTVTADGGAFGSPVLLPGERFTVQAPAAAGVYAYGCRLHASMRGAVTVSLVSLAPAPGIRVGGRPVLTGAVPGAAAGTPVRLERRVPGAWVAAGTAVTGPDGAFGLLGPPLDARTAFRAVAGDAVSPSVRAEVRPTVRVRRAGPRLLVRVVPAGGGRARLERLDLDTYRWRRADARRLRAGRAYFTLPAPGVYRAVVDPHAGLSEAASGTVPFRPGAFRS